MILNLVGQDKFDNVGHGNVTKLLVSIKSLILEKNVGLNTQ